MTQELLHLRKQKVKNEIETARRLEARGIHPLDVLDDLIQAVTDLMRVGILENNPNASEKEILKEMRDRIAITNRIKKQRKKW